MEADQLQYLIRTVSHVVMVIVLVLVLLGVLTWLGVIRCGIIPGWCDVYYGILGQPKVLIVHGDDGMGDPEALRLALANPAGPNIRVKVARLDYISLENLKNYHLVIVEQAKTMSTKSMRDLMLYADAGGRLIWTGDAGTELAAGDEYLYKDELFGKDAEHEIISPWARKFEDKQTGEKIITNLENYISVRYHGTYYGLTGRSLVKGLGATIKSARQKKGLTLKELAESISEKEETLQKVEADAQQPSPALVEKLEKALDVSLKGSVAAGLSGWMMPAEGGADHPLIYGMQPRLAFYGDFAVVTEIGGMGTKRVLNIDTATELSSDGKSLGRVVPLIVTSGIGEKIAYYAFPIEQLAEMNYSTLLENMYYGMVE